ncbi:hypothetical protein [Cellulomonas rhizosphaerae]|uniref:Uncharacterized protein n=1 Tax=Cellulomonas rhizosphaerae TaxID=2293719 RepID=A0A413RJK6_9CELL|nr:hypothetical protein [Cellulomonas rhizosphaerae]RHA38716.1 hypothetical protein D1825_13360 [Cellulomonas rhizosphaerae]
MTADQPRLIFLPLTTTLDEVFLTDAGITRVTDLTCEAAVRAGDDWAYMWLPSVWWHPQSHVVITDEDMPAELIPDGWSR